MRYPATQKLEIIRFVGQSHLSARQTLDKLGIPRPRFYRWYDYFLTHSVKALQDRIRAMYRDSVRQVSLIALVKFSSVSLFLPPAGFYVSLPCRRIGYRHLRLMCFRTPLGSPVPGKM